MEIVNIDTEGFEISEEALYRYERLSNYKYMMKVSLQFIKENHPKSKYFIEITAKCALENNDTDFAWKAAMYTEKIDKHPW